MVIRFIFPAETYLITIIINIISLLKEIVIKFMIS